MRRQAILAMAIGLAMASPASLLAHEGHGLTFGEAVSVADDSFQLKTAKEALAVKLTAETKFEKDKKPATKAMLKNGEWVGVETRKGASGELLATRIVFGVPAPAASKK